MIPDDQRILTPNEARNVECWNPSPRGKVKAVAP